jgi:hypothetical protein
MPADENIQTVAPIASTVTATQAAPAALIPAVDAAAPLAPAAPAVVEAPAEPVASVTETAKPAADAAPPTTILAEAAEKPAVVPEVKKEDVKAADGAEPKKEEAKQSDEPAPLPTYEAFTIPEGVTFDVAKLGEFQKELAEYQVLTKADQAETQKFGQKLVDRHIAEIQDAVKRVGDFNTKAWEKQTSDWKEAFVKDPEIGGNRQETTILAAKVALTESGALSKPEFKQLMDTGVGNHPELIRTFSNLGNVITDLKNRLAKYETETDVKPLPGKKPSPEVTSKVAKRYGA